MFTFENVIFQLSSHASNMAFKSQIGIQDHSQVFDLIDVFNYFTIHTKLVVFFLFVKYIVTVLLVFRVRPRSHGNVCVYAQYAYSKKSSVHMHS